MKTEARYDCPFKDRCAIKKCMDSGNEDVVASCETAVHEVSKFILKNMLYRLHTGRPPAFGKYTKLITDLSRKLGINSCDLNSTVWDIVDERRDALLP